jgi:SAM-dependent methyltransferase
VSHLPGEADWAAKLTPEETAANRRKPFVPQVNSLLAQAGAIMALLPPPPAFVLDAGCAEGHLARLLALQGYEVVGVDVCREELEWAREADNVWGDLAPRLTMSTPLFVEADFDEYEDDRFYDAVVFNSSLHHSLDRVATLKAAYRNLRPGGVVVAVEPGLGHGWTRVSRDVRARLGVTERSCPPLAVWWAGRQAGFVSCKVYPHPGTLAKALYGAPCPAENGFVRALRRLPFKAGLLAAAKWAHGAVVLTKGDE